MLINKIKDFFIGLYYRREFSAVKVLNEKVLDQITFVDVTDRVTYENWQRSTSELIKYYLGDSNQFYNNFVEINLTEIPINQIPTLDEYKMLKYKVSKANVILTDAILHIITTKKIIRSPSLFGLLPITGQISIGVLIAATFFAIGGKFAPTINKATFENEVKQSIRTIVALQNKCDSLELVIKQMKSITVKDSIPEK